LSANTDHCTALSWEDFHTHTSAIGEKVVESGFEPEVIVAIARGGLMPAAQLCNLLGVRDLLSFQVTHWQAPGQTSEEGAIIRQPLAAKLNGKSVLLVDDIVHTGKTFKTALKHLEEQGAGEVKTASLFVMEGSAFSPDYFSEQAREAWLIFPWSLKEDLTHFVKKQLEATPRAIPLKEIQHMMVKSHELYAPAKDVEAALHFLELRGFARSIPAKRWGGEVMWQKR